MAYEKLSGLRVDDYKYPGDDIAYEALKKIPLLDVLTDLFLKLSMQMSMLPEIQGDCYRVTEETCPEVYRIYKTALTRLDMPKEYPLYIKSEFEYNAYAAGGKEPIIVLYSSMVKNLTDQELLATLGHELGHIKGGHVLYINMISHLSQLLRYLPAGQYLTMGAYFAMMNWTRMQEFTADRAGALAAGGVEAPIKLNARLLGADSRNLDLNFDLDRLLKQNEEFDMESSDLMGKLIYAFQTSGQNHPWMVSRIKALHDWDRSGGFEEVLVKYHVK